MLVMVGMLSSFPSSWFWQGMNHFDLSTTRLLCVVSNYFASSHHSGAAIVWGRGRILSLQLSGRRWLLKLDIATSTAAADLQLVCVIDK
jgi:hypothetical protein